MWAGQDTRAAQFDAVLQEAIESSESTAVVVLGSWMWLSLGR